MIYGRKLEFDIHKINFTEIKNSIWQSLTQTKNRAKVALESCSNLVKSAVLLKRNVYQDVYRKSPLMAFVLRSLFISAAGSVSPVLAFCLYTNYLSRCFLSKAEDHEFSFFIPLSIEQILPAIVLNCVLIGFASFKNFVWDGNSFDLKAAYILLPLTLFLAPVSPITDLIFMIVFIRLTCGAIQAVISPS